MTEITQLSGPYVNPVLMKEVSVNGSLLYLRSVITPNHPFRGHRQLCGTHKTCNFNFLEKNLESFYFVTIIHVLTKPLIQKATTINFIYS